MLLLQQLQADLIISVSFGAGNKILIIIKINIIIIITFNHSKKSVREIAFLFI